MSDLMFLAVIGLFWFVTTIGPILLFYVFVFGACHLHDKAHQYDTPAERRENDLP